MSLKNCLLCTPSYGNSRIEAVRGAIYTATGKGTKLQVHPAFAVSSKLVDNYNQLWCAGLDRAGQGWMHLWLMQHDDIEIKTPCWADVMYEEMQRVGAAVLSVIVPIKGHSLDSDGRQRSLETSTGIEEDSHWRVRKLKLGEIYELPETFCAADTPWPDKALLVNDGLMMVDLTRPEFQEKDEKGIAKIFFENNYRIVQKEDGTWCALFAPEDWNFARMCHAAKLPVYATRKVDVIHHGGGQWSNRL